MPPARRSVSHVRREPAVGPFRPVVGVLLVGIAVAGLALALGIGRATPPGDPDRSPDGLAGQPEATRTPLPIPIPGHEVYGYLPYWEMDDGIAAHLAETQLTTLALFSVTHGNGGALQVDQNGHRRIAGPLGERLIAEAHERGVRVELVYTSFGERKNSVFFSRDDVQARTIEELVAFAAGLGVDGINVDVEQLRAGDLGAYGGFVNRLRAALRAIVPEGQVSVATSAHERGAAMAVAATLAGADRIFLMGYDYHWAGSQAGASAPLDRRDGTGRHLAWSLDLYRDLGVPVERTILGLPLYGMAWPVGEPGLGAPPTGRGEAWIPRRNLDVLADPTLAPTLDPLEVVEFIARPADDGWEAIYYDSPATLAPKLGLADARGLAGAGFWALGYERGLPAYTDLIGRFRAGEIDRPAAPGDP